MPNPILYVSLAVLIALAACTQPLAIDGRKCPCVSGYRCCGSLCLPGNAVCPGGSDAANDASTDAPAGAAGGFDVDQDMADTHDAAVDSAAPEIPESAGDGNIPSSDGPVDAAADATTAAWQTLGGLDDEIGGFDLQVDGSGLPLVAVSKLILPGRTRATAVFRHDGNAWQKLGADLPGSPFAVIAFAVSADGTPYVVSNQTIKVFQGGDWMTLPGFGNNIVLPTNMPVLGIDRSGRLHTIVVDTTTTAFTLMRFGGAGWDPVGPQDSLGKNGSYPLLAFDNTQPYVGNTDVDGMRTEVKRYSGSAWEVVGGGALSPPQNALVVAPDGKAYGAVAISTSIQVFRSAAAPWSMLDSIMAPYNVHTVEPALDLAPDGALHVAHIADRDDGVDVVPGPLVKRWQPSGWTALPTEGLDPNVFDVIKLRISLRAGRTVFYVAYSRTNRLVVKRLE